MHGSVDGGGVGEAHGVGDAYSQRLSDAHRLRGASNMHCLGLGGADSLRDGPGLGWCAGLLADGGRADGAAWVRVAASAAASTAAAAARVASRLDGVD